MSSFKPYQNCKDSKLNWLGDVPSHWEMINGQFLFRVINDKSKTGEEQLLSVSEKKGVTPRSEANVTMFLAESYKGYKLCKPGDLVINSMWAWSNGLGFSKYDGIVSTAYSVYRPNQKKLDYRFYNYLLKTERYVGQYEINSKGIWTSRLMLSDWAFLRIPILLPQKPEQTAIANFLESKTAEIQAFIALKEKTIALLQERKTAIINQAVTKGLDPNVEMKDSGIEWLGEIPKHWEVKKLKYVSKIQSGIALNGSSSSSNSIEISYLRVANVQDGYLDLEEVKTLNLSRNLVGRYLLKNGDLLMNEGGDYDKLGRGCIWQSEIEMCVHQNHVFAVRMNRATDPNWINAVTFTYYAKEYFKSKAKRTTNLASISSRNIKEFPVLFAPPDEQDAILSRIESMNKKLDSLISQAEKEITLIKEYQQSLISEAVTGKIDVREWEKSNRGYEASEVKLSLAAEESANYEKEV